MLHPFVYLAPDTLAEALALSQTCDGVRILAGGTALLVALERGQTTAGTVIDLKRIRALREIEVTGEGELKIGALVTMRELIASDLVSRHAPALAQTARLMATPQVRNLGTIGGNIASGLASADLGTIGGNIASGLASADLVTALLALDARVVTATHKGEERISLNDYMSRLALADPKASGIISAVIVPTDEERAAYHKLMVRQAADVPLANVAVWIRADAERIAAVRIAAGGCDGRPARLVEAEAALRDQVVSAEVIGVVARIATETAAQTGDQRASEAYRRRMVGVLVRRALTHLLSPQ